MTSEGEANPPRRRWKLALPLMPVLLALLLLGPGLRPLVLGAARAQRGAPWAPRLHYAVAWLEERTGRREGAQELWEEFVLHWSGDESRSPGLAEVAEMWEPPRSVRYMPWLEERAPQVSGPPHPLLPSVLGHRARYLEGVRDYSRSIRLREALVACFPDTPEGEESLRLLSRMHRRF